MAETERERLDLALVISSYVHIKKKLAERSYALLPFSYFFFHSAG